VLGNLAILGGNNAKITMIDLDREVVIGEPFETAMGDINSMLVFNLKRNENQVYLLCLTGEKTDYSLGKSDIYDIHKTTDMYLKLRRGTLFNLDSINSEYKNYYENEEIRKKQKIYVTSINNEAFKVNNFF